MFLWLVAFCWSRSVSSLEEEDPAKTEQEQDRGEWQ